MIPLTCIKLLVHQIQLELTVCYNYLFLSSKVLTKSFFFYLSTTQEAYVEYLNTVKLFEDMYADDPEGNKLNQIPGVDEMLVVYPLIVFVLTQRL